jgi:MarR family transcriptional regulator for hemolysin
MTPPRRKALNPFAALPDVWTCYQLTFELALTITRKRLAKFYAARGIELREVWILMGCRVTAASQSLVADCLGINHNVMVRIVDGLEAKKLIRRVRNPENRREYLLKVTSKGHAELRLIDRNFDNAAREAFRPISLEELQHLKDLAAVIIRSYYENNQE